MIIGNPDKFKYFLDFVPHILEIVLSSWRKMEKPEFNELETRINRKLGEYMRQEKNRRGLPLRISLEHSLTEEMTFKERGRIDICLLPCGSSDEEVYFALECKRLRVPYEKKIDSLASSYTGKDGMMCFITSQYSKNLSTGGMIGYVMKGNIEDAKKSVKKSIDNKRKELLLKANTSLECSSLFPDLDPIQETKHKLRDRHFVMHHIFLAVQTN